METATVATVVGRMFSWSLKGWGLVCIGPVLYFLHASEIREGQDKITVGQSVLFTPAPALPGKKHPRAMNAYIGRTE
jgi:hypothetical protein